MKVPVMDTQAIFRIGDEPAADRVVGEGGGEDAGTEVGIAKGGVADHWPSSSAVRASVRRPIR